MSASDETDADVNNENLEISQYWDISKGSASLCVFVMKKDLCMAQLVFLKKLGFTLCKAKQPL